MSTEHQTRTVTIEEAVRAAMELHRNGQLDEAEALYRQILDAAPENADALHFLGLLMRQCDRDAEALALMRRAVAAAPDYASAHNNLGNLLCEAGKLDEASRHLRRVLALAPHDPRALNNLGNVAHASGQADEAIRCFERAIALSPEFSLPYENLGRMRLRGGEVAQAYALFCKAVALDHTRTRSRAFVGLALCELGRYDEARDHYRKWAEAEPDNAEPRHLLASVEGGTAPTRASDDYVRSVFDGFARTFDVHLQKLQYRAPTLVVEALRAAGALDAIAVLDAGCGTGLCGPLLRPLAAKLDGVDLSPKMLEHARASGHYDALYESELTAFMRSRPGHYHAIACADTLCYFGELDEAAQAAFAALHPGGLFAVTLEALAADSSERYRLTHTGRYAHGSQYAQLALARAGFERASIRGEWLRMEAGNEVAGHVVVARKPAA
ncbi:MAG: tetratricopeptide repeat protein [Betaproteobacteria bacterium]|nr:tetratricopeptide repeat protein [Betaproteobacteria bacterium]